MTSLVYYSGLPEGLRINLAWSVRLRDDALNEHSQLLEMPRDHYLLRNDRDKPLSFQSSFSQTTPWVENTSRSDALVIHELELLTSRSGVSGRNQHDWLLAPRSSYGVRARHRWACSSGSAKSPSPS